MFPRKLLQLLRGSCLFELPPIEDRDPIGAPNNYRTVAD
jgi:hypothetical protein